MQFLTDRHTARAEALAAKLAEKSVCYAADAPAGDLIWVARYDGPAAQICWSSGTATPSKAVVVPWAQVDLRMSSWGHLLPVDALRCITTDITPGSMTSLCLPWLAGRFLPWPGGSPMLSMAYSTPEMLAKVAHGHTPPWQRIRQKWARGVSLVMSYGAKLEAAERAAIEDALNLPVQDWYTASETGLIAVNGEMVADVKIVDGTIRVRAPGLASGYMTQDGFRPLPLDSDGFWDTRDVGKIVDDRLRVHGRALPVNGRR